MKILLKYFFMILIVLIPLGIAISFGYKCDWTGFGSYLFGSNLKKAVLDNCNMFNANVSKADLKDANLRGVNLQLANLEEAKITERQLSNLVGLAGAIMPDGQIYDGKFGYEKDLHDAIGCGVDIDDKEALARWYKSAREELDY